MSDPVSWAQLAALERARRTFVLCTVTDTGGSTPRLAGARMAVLPDDFRGTIGGGAVEQHVQRAARRLLADPATSTQIWSAHLVRDLGMCCGGQMRVFMEKIEPAPRLWIYGAGHVGTALAAAAHAVDFEVTVIDPRAEWAAPARFPPGVTVVDAEPEDHLKAHPPPPDALVVVVTHDHPLDEALIRGLLTGEPRRYVGLIGSRGKWARFRERLAARGVDADRLEAVRCPVGLDLGAETPSEIAVSIVAGLVRERRGPKRAPEKWR